MNHAPVAIDYSNPTYWMYGGGAWSTRWECTSHDALLMTMTIVGTIWMVTEYFIVAKNSKRIAKESEGSVAEYMQAKTYVFLECGIIHVFNAGLAWFVTPYWIVVLLLFHNAITTRKMNGSRLRIEAELEMKEADKAKHTIERMKTICGNQEPAELPKQTLVEMARELRYHIVGGGPL